MGRATSPLLTNYKVIINFGRCGTPKQRRKKMNMSYCRFRNTLGDLRDCVYALEEGAEMSYEERNAAQSMRDMCERYLEAYDEYQEQNNEEQ